MVLIREPNRLPKAVRPTVLAILRTASFRPRARPSAARYRNRLQWQTPTKPGSASAAHYSSRAPHLLVSYLSRSLKDSHVFP